MDLFNGTCLISFILIKKGLIGLSALQVGSLRIIFADFFIVDWFQKFVKDSKRKWKFIA
jgi:hypothetical protein